VAVKIALDAHTWISTQKAEGNGSSSGTDDGKATNRPAASPQAFNVSLEGNPHPLRGLHKFRYLQFRRCDVRSRRVHNTEWWANTNNSPLTGRRRQSSPSRRPANLNRPRSRPWLGSIT